MQISSRFTIAVHICVCIDVFKEEKITSDFLANSIQVNPVIIRKILSQLNKAGLIQTARGTGGTRLAKNEDEITLLDIYKAVEPIPDGTLFHFHEKPNPLCPVGKNIHRILDGRLYKAQCAMENELAAVSLKQIFADAQKYISADQSND